MRITVHLPDHIESQARFAAENEHRSLSNFVADAVTFYIEEKRRKEQGQRILDLRKMAVVSPSALDELYTLRDHDDRF